MKIALIVDELKKLGYDAELCADTDQAVIRQEKYTRVLTLVGGFGAKQEIEIETATVDGSRLPRYIYLKTYDDAMPRLVKLLTDDPTVEPPKPSRFYSNKLDADEQISAEEMIAATIKEAVENEIEASEANGLEDKSLTDEDCNDLGRTILRAVLRRFRPDFFVPE